MQSDEDAIRIKKMGAPADKVLVTGNIKFDRDPAGKDADELLHRDLADSFGLGEESVPLIIAGSTHPGEEQVLLEALRRIRALPGMEKTRLLLAPRHPERFDAAGQLAEQKGFRVRRRTLRAGAAQEQEAEVLLLDTVGELAAAYRFATIVFVGGTLIPHGGHSIMEPALYSNPIVIGPFMENFRHILNEFILHRALLQISARKNDKNLQVRQLTDAFLRLLQNPKEREALGTAAFSILEKNRDASRRTFEKIEAVFIQAQMRASDRANAL